MLFAVFFGGIVLLFDVVIAVQLHRGADAGARFVPVPATVTASEIETTTSHGNRGGTTTTYTAHVEYRYEFAGVTHTADTVSYVEWGTSDPERAERIVAAHPIGAQVTAFVDPDDPARAVLEPGTEHFPFLVLLFLVPFHCVPAIALLARRHGRSRADAATLVANLVAFDDGTRAVLRPLPTAPALIFVIALTGLSFLATFVVAFTWGFGAGAGDVLQVIGGLAVASALFAAWWRRRAQAPARHTLVDGETRRILVGGLRSGEAAAELDWQDVQAITAESRSVGTAGGRAVERHRVRALTTVGESVDLLGFLGPSGAGDALADWLRARLGRTAVGARSTTT